MTIEKLQKSWKKVPVDQATKSDLSLAKIKQRRHTNLFLRIAIPELIITTGYLILILFLVAFFSTFQSLLLQTMAIGAIGLLLGIPLLSIRSFFRYYSESSPDIPVSDALIKIKKSGQVYMRTQYWLLALNLILMALLVLLMPLIYSEYLSTTQQLTAITFISICTVLIYLYIWKYYRKKINQLNEFATKAI